LKEVTREAQSFSREIPLLRAACNFPLGTVNLKGSASHPIPVCRTRN
jgi:hypothetical protein